MQNSAKFFANTSCSYFPCHEGLDKGEFNCLFCYCPLYFLPRCPGAPEYIERDGKKIKKCTNCVWPHLPENYGKLVKILKANMDCGADGPAQE